MPDHQAGKIMSHRQGPAVLIADDVLQPLVRRVGVRGDAVGGGGGAAQGVPCAPSGGSTLVTVPMARSDRP